MRHCEEAEVLIFDLTVVAKALVQLERSSEVLVFDLDVSPDATVQFELAMEVEEVFLGRCLHLHLDCFVATFSHAGAAALPLNMVESGCSRWCLRLWGDVTSLCTIPSCNL